MGATCFISKDLKLRHTLVDNMHSLRVSQTMTNLYCGDNSNATWIIPTAANWFLKTGTSMIPLTVPRVSKTDN